MNTQKMHEDDEIMDWHGVGALYIEKNFGEERESTRTINFVVGMEFIFTL